MLLSIKITVNFNRNFFYYIYRIISLIHKFHQISPLSQLMDSIRYSAN